MYSRYSASTVRAHMIWPLLTCCTARSCLSLEMPPDSVVVLPGELHVVFYRCTRCDGAFATPGHNQKPTCSSSGRLPRNYRHASLVETIGSSVGSALQQRGINTYSEWNGLPESVAEQELQIIVEFVNSQVQQLQGTAGVRLSADNPCNYVEAAVRELLNFNPTGLDKFAVFRGVPMSAGRAGE